MPHSTLVRVAPCALLFACTVTNPYDGDTFGPSFSETSTTQTTGDGDGDTGDGDGDGDTGDGDGDTGDGDTGDGDGDMGDGDGDTGDGDTGDGDTGDGDTDPCQRSRYVYRFDDDSWSSTPLDQLWTGANAPPCSVEPMSVAFVEPWDQLFVWAADAMLYRRVGGAWQAPEPIAANWGVVAGLALEAAYSIPPPEGDNTGNIHFNAGGEVHNYEVYEDGSTVFVQTTAQADWPDPGPQLLSYSTGWMFVLSDVANFGQVEWWLPWVYLSNDVLYHAIGGFAWENWPSQDSEMFDDAPPNISPANFEAAWGNFALDRAYFVGPS